MTLSTPAGVGLAIVAGLMSGNCMLPAKFLRTWRWENMWAVFSVLSLVVFPWGLALLFVSRLGEVYRSLPLALLIAPVGFGMVWGAAQILFGISCARLGLSLAYAIIVGMGAALGTLVPMLATQRNGLDARTVLLVAGGILLMAVGIALSAWSGRLREKETGAALSQGSGYRTAILLAILCGLFAPALNFSFAFGQGIAERAVLLGNSPLEAAYAVWPIGLAGGLIPNAIYSVVHLRRNRSWPAFRSTPPDLLVSTLMAALWMGAFAVYGMSAALLGTLGTSIGWGLFQIFMIMTASLSGLLTGEWRRASRASKWFVGAGMAILLTATLMLTAANRH